MARIHVVPVKAGIASGLAVLIIGLSFAAAAALSFTGFGGLAGIPLPLRIVFLFLGLIALLAGYSHARYGPAVRSAVERLGRELVVEGDRLVFPRPLRLKPGRLRARLERESSGYSVWFGIVEEEGPETVKDYLEPGDFPGSESVAANVDWSWSGLRVGAGPVKLGPAEPVVEWVDLPCYIVREEEYTTPAFDVCIAFLPRPFLPVALRRGTLQAVEGRDVARASVEVRDGVIHGTLEFYKAPGSRSRGARLEITGEYGGVRYTARIAELRSPGSAGLTWPKTGEPVYIVASDASTYSPSRLLKLLGITEPLILGGAWERLGNLKIKLVLDRPLARDVVDEEELIVTQESSGATRAKTNP